MSRPLSRLCGRGLRLRNLRFSRCRRIDSCVETVRSATVRLRPLGTGSLVALLAIDSRVHAPIDGKRPFPTLTYAACVTLQKDNLSFQYSPPPRRRYVVVIRAWCTAAIPVGPSCSRISLIGHHSKLTQTPARKGKKVVRMDRPLELCARACGRLRACVRDVHAPHSAHSKLSEPFD